MKEQEIEAQAVQQAPSNLRVACGRNAPSTRKTLKHRSKKQFHDDSVLFFRDLLDEEIKNEPLSVQKNYKDEKNLKMKIERLKHHLTDNNIVVRRLRDCLNLQESPPGTQSIIHDQEDYGKRISAEIEKNFEKLVIVEDNLRGFTAKVMDKFLF